MKFVYQPDGVCPSQIHIELDGDLIVDVQFSGGCSGNASGISSLVKGQRIDDVISRLNGIKCSGRSTSCPDQLSKALLEAKKKTGN